MQNENPLDQLADIHLPDPIGVWPLAWGWWFLIIILLATLALTYFVVKKIKEKNAYRHQAIQFLNQLKINSATPADYLPSAANLLHRCANHLNLDTKITGAAWLTWLDAQCPSLNHAFSTGVGRLLLNGPYQKNINLTDQEWIQLHELLIFWIKNHHAKKQSPIIKKNNEATRSV